MIKNWMESRYTISTLVARSAAMRRLLDRAAPLVDNESPLLIVGDSGAGKRFLARAIHNSSKRADNPFVSLPAARLAPDCTDSLLLGSARGEVGALERAQSGVLLLANIEDLVPVAQERLLNLLESGSYLTGKGKTQSLCSIRLLCTAHGGELANRLADGSFSEALYLRLSPSVLSMPCLRERNADIPYLVQDVLTRFAERERVTRPSVPFHYMELLTRVEWPENARQLRNHVESVMSLSEGKFEPAILLAHFEEIESPQPLKELVRDLLHKLIPAPQAALASSE